MKILALHNYYQQRGGEDQAFEDEVRVLRQHGHEVRTFTVHNDSVAQRGKFRVALQSLWNRSARRSVLSVLQEFRPGVLHAMNTFPLLSPSVLHAGKEAGVPVVLEVANYRLACAGGGLFRNGANCRDCVGRTIPWPAVRHRCYRGSLAGSAVLATSIFLHRWWQTWQRSVDLFLCPSQTTKQKLIEFGLPENRIFVKPNAVDEDPGIVGEPQDYVVFVGRLSPEKGLATLFEAWRQNADLPPLRIVGDGPQADLVRAAQQSDARITWLGRLSLPELLRVVGRASFLVMPSIWHEPFGRTTIEAFAAGTPVVGSRIGGTAEIIEEGRTGWLFEPGNPGDLAAKLRRAMSLSDASRRQMRQDVRAVYLERYTAESNYQQLLAAYEQARVCAAESR